MLRTFFHFETGFVSFGVAAVWLCNQARAVQRLIWGSR